VAVDNLDKLVVLDSSSASPLGHPVLCFLLPPSVPLPQTQIYPSIANVFVLVDIVELYLLLVYLSAP
jgi:hypothetical protein